jgi:hypothetical protein
MVAEAGVPAIEAHVSSLVERLFAGLDELGATVVTPRERSRRGPLVCVASTDPNALVAALAAERIVTSTRDLNLRISLHLYNVEEDVDAPTRCADVASRFHARVLSVFQRRASVAGTDARTAPPHAWPVEERNSA